MQKVAQGRVGHLVTEVAQICLHTSRNVKEKIVLGLIQLKSRCHAKTAALILVVFYVQVIVKTPVTKCAGMHVLLLVQEGAVLPVLLIAHHQRLVPIINGFSLHLQIK